MRHGHGLTTIVVAPKAAASDAIPADPDAAGAEPVNLTTPDAAPPDPDTAEPPDLSGPAASAHIRVTAT
ncbi:MAG: hypothetical protein LBH13_09230 [Cellulomonadaceae bacterium]|nr:hypothetical protein [Cellulomonadaceae bacterium]